MCTISIPAVGTPIPHHHTASILTQSSTELLMKYMPAPVCRCSKPEKSKESSKNQTTSSTCSNSKEQSTAMPYIEKTMPNKRTLDIAAQSQINMTPYSSPSVSPKPIYTHKLPDNFFTSNSPPAPISPISIFASKTNSPVSSPNLHPASLRNSLIDSLDSLTITPINETCPSSTTAATPHSVNCSSPLSNDNNATQTEKPYHRSTSRKRLSLDDFCIKQTVGTGSSARVHLAKSKINGKYYAVKAINKKDLVSRRQVEHVQNEREILGSVSHPFLVRLWGTFQTESHVFFVMDYVPGGEVFRKLRKKKKFTEDEAKFYAAEVTLAIEYLHSLDIAYRDLKPENILIDARGHVKITDFGFAKRVTDLTWTVCGTPDYLAPEIIRSQGYTKAVDWWSLGILIYEMLTGHPPFTAKNPVDQYQKILLGEISWPENILISDEAKDLIQNLLRVKATDRIGNLKNGSQDIKNHPWFKCYDFADVLARKITPPHIPDIKYDGDTHCFDYYEELQLPYHMMTTTEPYCTHFANF
ncbi:kinase-like domain-containing protein [Mycotypha africana]|uniref:kinase-like domain-containing protein n=1 Tax=Mycotypha africana TaxID=64632 RepID=UPI0023007250|nr:kinase-like domain-containing protein [Mycotypha africana]KAI8979520.1 kinase-like domain-containing protein [Mycotypha africana]